MRIPSPNEAADAQRKPPMRPPRPPHGGRALYRRKKRLQKLKLRKKQMHAKAQTAA